MAKKTRTDATPPRLLETDLDHFRANFGKHPFELKNNFAQTELFTLPKLISAAERLIDKGMAGRFSSHIAEAQINSSWDAMPSLNRGPEVIEQIGKIEGWAKISGINFADPVYEDVMQSALKDIEDYYGEPLRDSISYAMMTVFMNSPSISVPYHIDHGHNILSQVTGEKEIALYEPGDRENLPDNEIEAFYFGDMTAAKFKPDMIERAKVFTLRPGVSVHIPSLGGHWVRNGGSVSISVSIGFCSEQVDRDAYVYQANYLLRRAGLRPATPNCETFADRVKLYAMRSFRPRQPKSVADLLYTGPNLIKSPFKAGQKFVHGVKGALKERSGNSPTIGS